VRQRLSADSVFQLLPVPKIDRRPVVNQSSWDHTQTILPFILRHPHDSAHGGMPLTREETARVYRLLRNGNIEHPDLRWSAELRAVSTRHCKLGQPVQCGEFRGVPVSALRLCASIPLIVDAVSASGRGSEAVIREALLVLEKTALLTNAIDHLAAA
jgi:hypothetical protein